MCKKDEYKKKKKKKLLPRVKMAKSSLYNIRLVKYLHGLRFENRGSI